MLMHQAAPLAWGMLALVVAVVTAGFIVSPWVGIAAIGLSAFICVMLLSFVIMTFGFYSVTGANISLHTLALSEHGLTVEFEDGKTLHIARSDISPYHIYPGGVVVPVNGARAGWLWLPPRAFPSPEAFQSFLSGLYNTVVLQR